MGTFGKIVLRWIELDRLDRLDRLDMLDRLDKLDKLDMLDMLDKLDRLDRLDRLDAENWINSFVSLCAFATWWQKKVELSKTTQIKN